jgi:hypothetical protein
LIPARRVITDVCLVPQHFWSFGGTHSGLDYLLGNKLTGRPIVKDERAVIGLSRHWDGLGSTSAMWLIADDGGIEQPDGSILHQ